jgi:hypothetical protein
LVAIYRVDGWENRKVMGWIGRGIGTKNNDRGSSIVGCIS